MALRDEPNRLRPIGHAPDRPLGRTESKLFPNGTNRGGERRAKKNPAPVRTGEHAPERGARGNGEPVEREPVERGRPSRVPMVGDTAVRAL